HTGEALLQAFIRVIERHGLQKKILAITSDNGSNVKSMLRLLQDHTNANPEWLPFNAQDQHVPCIAHILNLAVQALLGVHGLGASAPTSLEPLSQESPIDAEQEGEDKDGTNVFVRTSIAEPDAQAEAPETQTNSTPDDEEPTEG
ncbi:hypothetical protein DFQ26_001821, partial [Actinomortierella ambigua]